MTLTRTLAALAAAAALAACQDAGERSVAMLRPGSSFTVARIDGAPAPAGVTFEVGEGSRVTGRAPCNRYSGQLTESGGAMTVSGTVMTRMACGEADRMMAETRFGIALGSVTAARRTGEGIALTDPEGRERLGLVPAGGQ
ncbi:META domain-containing protein [Paracoccus sp. YIM 132242]|uniref:META domain-containing protein n=1 Tax=Paracoccus lichenicola TaxID=2665644 RepID=A0A6L6HMN1_9RHOB|nr:META domain-containing protein [Paracoccus lichenicola]MTE00426.1 META domain-containing protein [Paracoccus lichenicola]